MGHKPINISIPKPCSQKWEEMSAQGKGKFCDHCKKEVVDLTGFSDTDLFNYLKSNPIACGRFYTDQLARKIVPLQHKNNTWKNLYRFAAGLITLISFKSVANAAVRRPAETYQQPYFTKENSRSTPGDTSIISGRVIDIGGNPVSGAVISLDGKVVSVTEADGKFSFTPEVTNPKSYILNIAHPQINSVVRTYHPAMGSSDYSVTLSPPAKLRNYTMGVLTYEDMKWPSLTVDGKVTGITEDNKTTLAEIATMLRNHPDLPIQLSGGGSNDVERKKTKQLLLNVKTWLVEQEGIDTNRIIINNNTNNPELIKTIQIKTCTKE